MPSLSHILNWKSRSCIRTLKAFRRMSLPVYYISDDSDESDIFDGSLSDDDSDSDVIFVGRRDSVLGNSGIHPCNSRTSAATTNDGALQPSLKKRPIPAGSKCTFVRLGVILFLLGSIQCGMFAASRRSSSVQTQRMRRWWWL